MTEAFENGTVRLVWSGYRALALQMRNVIKFIGIARGALGRYRLGRRLLLLLACRIASDNDYIETLAICIMIFHASVVVKGVTNSCAVTDSSLRQRRILPTFN